MSNSKKFIDQAEKFSAKNYLPLPIVLNRGEGIWVWDVDGKKYMDCLSAYSALNHGHRHPTVVRALCGQAEKLTLTSRAFHNDQMGPLLEKLCTMSNLDLALPMNTGAEAVETALKTARKWGYTQKEVADDQAEIIVCNDNFHGRTTTITGFSSEPAYRAGFGPFTPGFKLIDYGSAEHLASSITKNTVGFLVEPIQGEAGIIVPPKGFLKQCQEICKKNRVLLMLDEIQTGLGRTGKLFAYQHELDTPPDILIVGKALGGGVFPVSAVMANQEVLGVFQPGEHGSTFGGNPLGAAAALAALEVLETEKLVEASASLGTYLLEELNSISTTHVQEIRGVGLFVGIELKKSSGSARPFCEKLGELGVLAKETHDQVIRLAPPLIIQKEELDWMIDKVKQVLTA